MDKNLTTIHIKNIIYTLLLPVTVFLLMEILCFATKGRHLFTGYVDFLTLMRTTVSTTCIGLALACNVTSGRFDFSLGSILVVSTILGGNLAVRFGMGGMGMLVMGIGIGAIMGMVVGLIYVLTRIPPVILSLGMALIYEAVSFWLFGARGFKSFGVAGLELLSKPIFLIAILLLAVGFMTVVNHYTGFGFNYRALSHGQQVAVNSGIKEKKNAVICYTLAGGLIAIAGIIKCAYQGGQDPVLGLASVGTVFSAMLPVFIGGYLGKYSNSTVGLLAGSVSLCILNLGMSNMMVSLTKQSLINAILLLVFLVFQNNRHLIFIWRKNRKRIEMAMAGGNANGN